MPNLPTYHQDQATVTARSSEVPNASFTDGCNKAGACAPGIGISTGVIEPKLDDWTVNDQDGNARDPQNSQHIGGDGLGDGNTANEPIRAIQSGGDENDTLTFIEAVVQATDGSGMGAAGADPINRTGQTVEVGERVWGTNSVA